MPAQTPENQVRDAGGWLNPVCTVCKGARTGHPSGVCSICRRQAGIMDGEPRRESKANAPRTKCAICSRNLRRSPVDEEGRCGWCVNKINTIARVIAVAEPILQSPGGTLEKAGAALGVCRERVRQIINQYPELAHLRRCLAIQTRAAIREQKQRADHDAKLAAKASRRDTHEAIIRAAFEQGITIRAAALAMGHSKTSQRNAIYSLARTPEMTEKYGPVVRAQKRRRPSRDEMQARIARIACAVLVDGKTLAQCFQELGYTSGCTLTYGWFSQEVREASIQNWKTRQRAGRVAMKGVGA